MYILEKKERKKKEKKENKKLPRKFADKTQNACLSK